MQLPCQQDTGRAKRGPVLAVHPGSPHGSSSWESFARVHGSLWPLPAADTFQELRWPDMSASCFHSAFTLAVAALPLPTEMDGSHVSPSSVASGAVPDALTAACCIFKGTLSTNALAGSI